MVAVSLVSSASSAASTVTDCQVRQLPAAPPVNDRLAVDSVTSVLSELAVMVTVWPGSVASRIRYVRLPLSASERLAPGCSSTRPVPPPVSVMATLAVPEPTAPPPRPLAVMRGEPDEDERGMVMVATSSNRSPSDCAL